MTSQTLSHLHNYSHPERLSHIRLVVFDIDGVMTDGSLIFDNSGEPIKAFHAQDGQGIVMLQTTGVEVGIITAKNTEIVSRRAASLGIKYLTQGRKDKLTALKEMIKPLNFTLDQVAYVGDDLPDLAAIEQAKFGIAVANAHWYVQSKADAVTSRSGGQGAVREICDFIMMAQNTWESALQPWLSP